MGSEIDIRSASHEFESVSYTNTRGMGSEIDVNQSANKSEFGLNMIFNWAIVGAKTIHAMEGKENIHRMNLNLY
jgi:hypothetical protein